MHAIYLLKELWYLATLWERPEGGWLRPECGWWKAIMWPIKSTILHEGFYGLHKLMNHFWSKFCRSSNVSLLMSHGECLQHTEALSSAHIPAYTVRPLVALKGLSHITTHLKGKWHVLNFQIAANFLIQCAFFGHLFQFWVLSFLKKYPLYH